MAGDAYPAPCPPLPAAPEVMPGEITCCASIIVLRFPLRPRFLSADIFYLNRNLTPGITRRPARLLEYDKQRVGGRVHAVVRRRR
jgi:hypothetical protein